MPTVQGRVVKPSGGTAGVGRVRVRFRLVDSSGNQVTQAWDTNADRLIVDYEDKDLDGEGDYSIDLPSNTDIEPAGTRWSRVVVLRGNEGPARSLVVPVGGGPYDEKTILEDAVVPLPTPEPSNEIDIATVTTTHGPFAGDAFGATLHSLSNTTVTVPQLSRPVWLRAHAGVIHATANGLRGIAIAPVGSTTVTQAIGRSQGQGATAGGSISLEPWARLPANSAGDYQLFAFGLTGNITVNGAASDPTSLGVLAV